MSLGQRLRSFAAVAKANFVPFERPDRIPRALLAAAQWGLGTCALLAAAAARYPTADAVIDDEGSITFEELWNRGRALALALRARGAVEGAAVGVMCRNHRGFVVACAAIAASGADLVLLNTGFAAPQLADVVADEHVAIVIHDDEFSDLVARCGAAHTFDEATTAAMSCGPDYAGRPTREGRVIILTSGTTGRPRGAARRADAGAAEAAGALLARIPLRARDTQVVSAPLFHAWGFAHLMFGLGRSATTVVSRRFDPSATLTDIERHRARVLVVVPVMLQRILGLAPTELARRDTSSLEIIALSGSALGGRMATEAINRFGPVIYNTYGSTEVAVASIATPDDLRRHPTTVGRPAPGVVVRILGNDGNDVATGANGRIFVGNGGRFDGYTSGVAKETQHDLLASGDVGHFDHEGLLFVDGREDDMVISGGENLFPGEVEELLLHHQRIADAAVIGVPDDEFGQVLAAFVVVAPGHTLTADDVRDYVRTRLARFKVPKTVAFLDELPRTTTGKVLRNQLPNP